MNNEKLIKEVSKIPQIESQMETIMIYQKPSGEIYNNISLQEFINNHTHIRVKKDNYKVNKSIKIPSNRTIIFEEGCNITLEEGCNQYILRNEDWINGNENIFIQGGNFYGNGETQTRKFDGATLEDCYYGFGSIFYKVKNLKVLNQYYEEINAWGVGHYSCDNAEFGFLRFRQLPNSATNGDGVTGQSNNLYIHDISGYTNDDLVAVGAYGMQMGANESLFPAEDVENVVIENITGIPYLDKKTYKLVALYVRYNKKMMNVTVNNVKGSSEQTSVLVWGYQGNFENINLKGISARPSLPVGSVKFVNASVKNVNISNFSRKDNDDINYAPIIFEGDYTRIDSINFNNINLHWNPKLEGSLIYDGGGDIKNVNLNNISVFSENGIYCPIYQKNSNSAVTTNIIANNIITSGLSPTKFAVKIVKGKVSLDSLDVLIDKNLLTAKNGDKIFDASGTLLRYYNGAWYPLIGENSNTKLLLSMGATQSITSTFDKINFTTKINDINNEYSTVNKEFTAKTDGFYVVNLNLGIKNSIDNNKIGVVVYKNGVMDSVLCDVITIGVSNVDSTIYSSTLLKLMANDIISVQIKATNATTINHTNLYTKLSICKL